MTDKKQLIEKVIQRLHFLRLTGEDRYEENLRQTIINFADELLKTEWIKVEDRLPNHYIDLWFCTKSGIIFWGHTEKFFTDIVIDLTNNMKHTIETIYGWSEKIKPQPPKDMG